MSRSFTCAVCGLTYRTETTEVEMNREFLNSGIASGATLLSACDDCYGAVMKASRGESRG